MPPPTHSAEQLMWFDWLNCVFESLMGNKESTQLSIEASIVGSLHWWDAKIFQAIHRVECTRP